MEYLNLNLDKNLTLNSNTTISSQKALKSYIDAKRINLDFLQASAPSEFSIGDKWLNTTDKKLYTATSSSTWDSGVSLTDGQIYSFENLLYHYDGTNILIYSTETITEQNNRNEIKSWFGTQNEYDALSEIDDNTTYYIVDNASVVSTLLATQQEFNNSVQNKAATPYQVNQKLGNYLPLAGGNLDANAVLRLTNSNNGTVTLAYNTSNYLTVSSNLSVNGTTSTNSLIATSGNIYNGSISGDTVVWSNTLNDYLPLSGGTMTGDIYWQGANNKNASFKLTGNGTNIDIGWEYSTGSGAGLGLRSSDFSGEQGNFNLYARKNTSTYYSLLGKTTGSLTWRGSEVQTAAYKGVANGIASLDANIKIPTAQLPLATVSSIGAVQPDGTTTSVDANGVISVIGGGSGGGSVILLQFLQSTTPTTYSTDDKWLNTSDYKLYTATSSSAWDSGIAITEDQIFGFNNLLYHYNGTSLEIYSTESIKEQNVGNETKLWVGTQDEYDAISTYDNNTIYNIIDSSTSYSNQYHPPLLSFMWSDHLLNDVRWLRADTDSWQDGGVYSAAYSHLYQDVQDGIFQNMYYWETGGGLGCYTKSANPQVGDLTYWKQYGPGVFGISGLTSFWVPLQINAIDSSGIYVDGTSAVYVRTSASDITGPCIIFDDISSYKAPDGHRIGQGRTGKVVPIHWYFVLDVENQRFKLPYTKFGFTGLRDNVGKDVAAGLPNITGTVSEVPAQTVTLDLSYGTGAFGDTVTASSKTCNSGGTSQPTTQITFNASYSNSIYGNSNTVQPPATQMYLYFYVGNYTEQAIEQTAGLNSELFNDKVDLDASNFDNTGKSLIAGLGMPSDTYVDLTLGSSGDTYYAPANGWFYLNKSGNAGEYNIITNV